MTGLTARTCGESLARGLGRKKLDFCLVRNAPASPSRIEGGIDDTVMVLRELQEVSTLLGAQGDRAMRFLRIRAALDARRMRVWWRSPSACCVRVCRSVLPELQVKTASNWRGAYVDKQQQQERDRRSEGK
ncbi:hypothetical protein PHYSODRAFT_297967 [Phytophthora sojae]|uniref:Uncharacterized protein n=1 Tax=Phytophthora sojae (strain P6497) TaxID=1094619 RepID=G4Z3L3_PHYSP|nr:hypothetical protein PHYSODRAFT_297967 [Phytophthora sojae]EGZ19385.1 hypothetical protein PHYSODRAFT_297967 [Phytophthora sojae]|eukprot:XP_009522102.1 hypothetical protein PHYSODRAFT_297967 [Phytophthora sojae]